MTIRENELGQPIGEPLEGWEARPHPPRAPASGRYCRLEPFDADAHGRELYEAYREDASGGIWTYLGYGPFRSESEYLEFAARECTLDDPLFHTIVDAESGLASGVASLMRIDRAVGVIEVGHINYAPRLQRTRAATESMFLLMRRVFAELGYRRYEWKCDALNGPSRNAAARLGFRYEGTFRQATVYKRRNRDTAWFSIIDRAWPALEQAYTMWLAPENFDASGGQIVSLSTLTARTG